MAERNAWSSGFVTSRVYYLPRSQILFEAQKDLKCFGSRVLRARTDNYGAVAFYSSQSQDVCYRFHEQWNNPHGLKSFSLASVPPLSFRYSR